MWAFKRSMCKHNGSGTTKTLLELADIMQCNNNPAVSLVDWPKSGKTKLYAPHCEVIKRSKQKNPQGALHISQGCWVSDSRTMVHQFPH